jgi:hypothetical protein
MKENVIAKIQCLFMILKIANKREPNLKMGH